MSEENMPEDIRVQHPEQGEVRDPARMEELAQELAIGHDQQSEQIAAMQAKIDELEARLAAQSAEMGSRKSSEPEHSAEVVHMSDTERDLQRLADITGRTTDDSELLKLNLRLKLDQFNALSEAYDAQEGTGRQAGFMQDMATAKRELEEAMFLCDPDIRKVFEQQDRVRLKLERTTDPAERHRLAEELRRLKDHGNVEGHGQPRREIADRFTDRLGDIASSLEGSEILATYESGKRDNPEEPIENRRRTDTVDWRGKPEYDENGVYVGSSPQRGDGRWVLEPKPPLNNQGSIDTTPVSEPPVDRPPTSEGPGDGEGEPGDDDKGPEAGEGSDDGKGPGEDEKGPEEDDKGPDDKDKPKLEKVEVPPIDSGDYPELYARMKNLVGGDKERLLEEAERLKNEIDANVRAQVINFLAENPNATAEQVDQLLMQCAVEAKNKLAEDILAAIDGRGYTDAEGHEKGKSRWRRFGAWMDKHGSKLKKGMLIAGAAGAVVLTGGVLAGAIVPAFAIGAGTVWGAAKGAAVGLGMSRHGSKESASKNVDIADFRDMTPEERAKYTGISDYLMSEFNKSADGDHRTNVSKSRRAAIVGAVVGGLFGSLSFSSPDTVSTPPQIEYEQVDLEIPNSPPDIPNFDIDQGQLTGDVIRETLQKMGLNGDRFVNPDGSTNLDFIVNRFFNGNWDAWHDVNALPNGTHSMAGADNISNEGIRKVIESVVADHDWGSHIETVDIPKLVPGDVASGLESSLWANITKEITGLLLAAGISKEVADRTKPVPGKSPESEEPEEGPETPPPVDGGSQGEDGREPPETTTGINGPIDGGPVVTETSGGPEGAEKETETEIELGGQKFTVGRSYDINSPYEGRDEKVRYRYLGFDERSRQHQFEEEEGGRILYRNNDALRLMVGNRNIAPAS
jgi:hypothetical protein